jgi:hypothetical protein
LIPGATNLRVQTSLRVQTNRSCASLSVRHAALIRNGAINSLDCVLDKDNGLTHIFGMTALVLRRHRASDIATIRNLFVAGGN